MSIPLKDPIAIFRDNKLAIHIATNPVFHERTKHIEMDCHIVRDKIQASLIHLLPIHNNNQITDVYTKALHPDPFNHMTSKLGLIDFCRPACGAVSHEPSQEVQ